MRTLTAAALSILCAMSFSESGKAQGDHVLRAGIMHSESIKSVADLFPVGHTFKPSMIPQSSTDILWYRMPECFGGSWVTDQATYSG
ncbi:MAG TPA: hypothetical protein V6C72_05325, partial [Chroococcales cyanobacterium]